MARPRQFDERAALEAAMHRFWVHGYERTTVRDLSDEMGVTLASFYNAFGDKRSIFERALQLYICDVVGGLAARLDEDHPPLAILRGVFADLVEDALADPDNKGCLLANSAIDVAPHDRDARTVVAQVLTRVEQSFETLIRKGQRDGSISTAQPAGELASMLLALLVSVRVLVRARPERALLEGAIRPVFALLVPLQSGDGAPPRAARRRKHARNS